MCMKCLYFTLKRADDGKLDWMCSKDDTFKNGFEKCESWREKNMGKKWCIDCKYHKDEPNKFPCNSCQDDDEKPCFIKEEEKEG